MKFGHFGGVKTTPRFVIKNKKIDKELIKYIKSLFSLELY
jgi:hypothetical protein